MHAHACWGFEDRGAFHEAVVEFLGSALARGHRVAYVSAESDAEMRAGLGGLGDVDHLIDSGSLELLGLRELYSDPAGHAPGAALARVNAATERALSDGYSGLRVAVEGTRLLDMGATLEAHIRWEATIDRYMSSHPFSALCGYDRLALPEPMSRELRSIHPLCNGRTPTVPFRLFFGDDQTMVVTGEVDRFAAESFGRLLELSGSGEAPTVIDLERLGFIDHHGLQALASSARHSENIRVAGLPPSVRRLCELLEVEL